MAALFVTLAPGAAGIGVGGVKAKLGLIGMTPWVSAALLVALADPLLPRGHRARELAPPTDRRLSRRIDGLALGLLVVQAVPLARALAALSDAAMAPILVALLGGPLLARAGAATIDRWGLGNGLVVMVAAETAGSVPAREAVRAVLDGRNLLLPALVPVVAAAALTAAITRHERDPSTGAPWLPAGLVPVGAGAAALGLVALLPGALRGLFFAPAWLVQGLGAGLAGWILALVWFHPERVLAWEADDATRARRRGALVDASRAGAVRSAVVCGALGATVDPALLSHGVLLTAVPAMVTIALVAGDLAREWRARGEAQVAVVRVERGWQLGGVLRALDAAGVAAFARGSLFRGVTPFVGAYAPVEVWVAPRDLPAALAAVAPLLDPDATWAQRPSAGPDPAGAVEGPGDPTNPLVPLT